MKYINLVGAIAWPNMEWISRSAFNTSAVEFGSRIRISILVCKPKEPGGPRVEN